MKITSIENDDDLTAAIREIDRLWLSEPGSEDGAELERLSEMVVAYEDEHYPIRPMTGFLATLSDEQQKSALGSRDGNEIHGDDSFRLRP